jgi:hypothetical protein
VDPALESKLDLGLLYGVHRDPAKAFAGHPKSSSYAFLRLSS